MESRSPVLTLIILSAAFQPLALKAVVLTSPPISWAMRDAAFIPQAAVPPAGNGFAGGTVGSPAKRTAELTNLGGGTPPLPQCSEHGTRWVLNADKFQLDGPPLIGRFIGIPFSQVRLQKIVDCDLQPDTQPVSSFKWQIAAKADGSKATLSEANTLNPKVWFDIGGDYTIRFVACPNTCVLPHGEHAAMRNLDLPVSAFSNAIPTSVRFRLNSFEILNTMAHHLDSDYVFLTAKNGGEVVAQIYNFVGDLNNGTYFLDWEFEKPLKFESRSVVISYEFVNAGHGSADQTKAAAKAVTDTVQSVGAGAGIDATGTWQALGSILDMLLPNCDGVILAGNILIVPPDFGHDVGIGNNMVIQPSSLAGRPFEQATFSYRGPDTPVGCGSNAQYKVTVRLTPVWDPQPPPIAATSSHHN